MLELYGFMDFIRFSPWISSMVIHVKPFQGSDLFIVLFYIPRISSAVIHVQSFQDCYYILTTKWLNMNNPA